MTRRPLVGEPLALDLVNTQWVERGRMVDLFDEPDGLRGWLAEHHLEGDPAAVETPLRETRSALRRVLEQPDEAAERGINAILARGASRYTLRDGSSAGAARGRRRLAPLLASGHQLPGPAAPATPPHPTLR